MGMPRYLKTRYENTYSNKMQDESILRNYIDNVLMAGVHGFYKIKDIFFNRSYIERDKMIDDLVMHNFKNGYIQKLEWTLNNVFPLLPFKSADVRKRKMRIYIGLEKIGREYHAVNREVHVSNYFVDKLTYINEEKELKDRAEVKIKEGIFKYENKIFTSRAFPPKLRELIFQRDNRTCQICGRDLSKLIKLGLHLEVDHTEEYAKGGETTLSNGRTVCNECNIGSFHANAHMDKVKLLDSTPF